MKKNLLPLAIIFSLVFTACSIKYGDEVSDESVIPEFIFDNSVFSRYEDNVKTMSLQAERLEQYKVGKSLYGREVDFSIFSKSGELETVGNCGLLAANSNDEKYALYDHIAIDNKKDKLKITASSLKWDGKTEQLISGRNEIVSIEKGGTIMRGSGFSASGVTNQFSFTGYVSGNVDTSKKDGEESEPVEELNPLAASAVFENDVMEKSDE